MILINSGNSKEIKKLLKKKKIEHELLTPEKKEQEVLKKLIMSL